MERWQSGRMRILGKDVCEQSHRGFESLLLRNRPAAKYTLLRFAVAREGGIRKTEPVYKTNEVSACRRVGVETT